MTSSEAAATISTLTRHSITFRPPQITDGARLWTAVRDTGVLDLNSPYAYLLVSSHFAGTSLLAESDGVLLGFVAAYRPPLQPDTIFVWQIATTAEARGQGLGTRLLLELLRRQSANGVTMLEGTVTPSNTASRRLFSGIATKLDVPCNISPWIAQQHFPATGEAHEPEDRFRIGPFSSAQLVAYTPEIERN